MQMTEREKKKLIQARWAEENVVGVKRVRYV